MKEPTTSTAATPHQTSRALAARQARTDTSLQRVRETVDRMVKGRTPIAVAVARRADVSRTFLYDNPEARRIVEAGAAQAAGRRAEGRHAEQQALHASWRERALNSKDALRAAHTEILRQREQIAELLGQIRDLNTGWTEDDRIRLTSENLALKTQRARSGIRGPRRISCRPGPGLPGSLTLAVVQAGSSTGRCARTSNVV